jgi:hypothetical protein
MEHCKNFKLSEVFTQKNKQKFSQINYIKNKVQGKILIFFYKLKISSYQKCINREKPSEKMNKDMGNNVIKMICAF